MGNSNTVEAYVLSYVMRFIVSYFAKSKSPFYSLQSSSLLILLRVPYTNRPTARVVVR